jgi:hypothetical protein
MRRGRAVSPLPGAVAIALTVAAAVALTVTPAVAQPPVPVASARLQGTFQMVGTVTIARNVRGERVGQHVVRSWAFTSECVAGPCASVLLVRSRGKGADVLALRMIGPAHYVGTGSFYAPMRCGRRTNLRGERVPFTISLRITAAELVNGVAMATGVAASYVNASRINETACVAVLGHDAAFYNGQPEPPPPPPPPPPSP